MKSNIVLTGFMGTGKTTAGKIVANKLNMKFVDMDNMIEKQEGMKISQIFSEKGEKHFRDIESEMVKGFPNGAVCNIYRRRSGLHWAKHEIIKRKGLIVLLKASVESIIKHTSSIITDLLMIKTLKKNKSLPNQRKNIIIIMIMKSMVQIL